MAERRLIFNAKGFQLGYIEGDAAFDLSGRRRCSYTGATGNLGDFDSGKILGHISLDGTFVGASWLSDDLFGKPKGEARPDRFVKARGAHSTGTPALSRSFLVSRRVKQSPVAASRKWWTDGVIC